MILNSSDSLIAGFLLTSDIKAIEIDISIDI